MIENNLSDYNKKNIPNIEIFHFGIIVSEWNPTITKQLLHGVTDTFYKVGINQSQIEIFKVPGSFELIFASNQLVKSNLFDAIISIGCLIKGETQNFHYICSAITNGIKEINLNGETPVIFCVLTDNHIQQSFDRSGGKKGNKGIESAISAIKMANFKKITKKLKS